MHAKWKDAYPVIHSASLGIVLIPTKLVGINFFDNILMRKHG